MLIEVSNLRKSYKIDDCKTQEVLRGLSFSIDSGELVAVVGESGSGKSSLLNIIGGLDSNFDGDISISGKPLNDYKQKDIDDYRKLKVGFIFQSFNLIPTYTVLENILTPANLTNMSAKQKKDKAHALLDKLGISELKNKRPPFLSGGEKQRVAIARALMNDPDIILADEPTGALDKDNADNIISLLCEIASEGKTVIVVTHSDTVASYCNRIIRLEYGLICDDTGALASKATSNKNSFLLSKKLSYKRSLSAAFKNIRKNKSRNILVALGTGIGIFSVVILLFLSKGIGAYVEDQMFATNSPLLLEVTKSSASGGRLAFAALLQSEPFNDSELARIQSIDGIASIEKSSLLTNSASFSADDISGNLAVLSTLNPSFAPDLIAGSMPAVGEVLINEAVAASFSMSYDLLLGKSLTLHISDNGLSLSIQLTISGVIENSGSVSDRFRSAYLLFDDLAAAYGSDSTPPVTSIFLTAYEQSDVFYIKSELSFLGFNSGSRDAALDRIFSFISIVTSGLTAIAAVSLIVSGIMILIVLFISVVERTKEIGTLRALGARASDIRRVFIFEGALLGLASGFVGVVLALFLSCLANFIASRYLGVSLIAVNLPNMFDGLLIALGVSIPASLIPAAKASNIDPILSLRHE